MKTEIKVAVSYVKVTHEIRTVDLPEKTTFYKKGTRDDLSTYEVFGIILYGKNTQSGHYVLVQCSRNIQLYNDFIPRKDVSSEFWVDGNVLRKTALSIIDKSGWGWSEITKEEFDTERQFLLDTFYEYIEA